MEPGDTDGLTIKSIEDDVATFTLKLDCQAKTVQDQLVAMLTWAARLLHFHWALPDSGWPAAVDAHERREKGAVIFFLLEGTDVPLHQGGPLQGSFRLRLLAGDDESVCHCTENLRLRDKDLSTSVQRIVGAKPKSFVGIADLQQKEGAGSCTVCELQPDTPE